VTSTGYSSFAGWSSPLHNDIAYAKIASNLAGDAIWMVHQGMSLATAMEWLTVLVASPDDSVPYGGTAVPERYSDMGGWDGLTPAERALMHYQYPVGEPGSDIRILPGSYDHDNPYLVPTWTRVLGEVAPWCWAAGLTMEEAIQQQVAGTVDLAKLRSCAVQRGYLPNTAAMDHAMEQANTALSTPVGKAREDALKTLRNFVEEVTRPDTRLYRGHTVSAKSVLQFIPLEARPDAKFKTVAGCIGVALTLLDSWFSGGHPDAPAGLAQRTRVPAGQRTRVPANPRSQYRTRRPAGHRTAERVATDVLAVAAKGQAFRSMPALNSRYGGRQLLYGSALALAAGLEAWEQITGTSVPELAETEITGRSDRPSGVGRGKQEDGEA
jgi:hypothetical protein